MYVASCCGNGVVSLKFMVSGNQSSGKLIITNRFHVIIFGWPHCKYMTIIVATELGVTMQETVVEPELKYSCG